MNSTIYSSTVSNDKELYIICSLSAGFGLISIILSMTIVIIVKHAKRRLHTVRHLLTCNTCIASMLYCIIQTINYIFLIFLPSITSDVACRWRGYFAYMSISAATYSYLVQAVSRLFFSIFARKYPWLTTFKAHYVLIFIHWLIVLIIPLPSVITKDIYFRPGSLCWVPFKYLLHMGYTAVAYYVVPVVSIIIIYIYIYRKIRRTKQSAETILNTTNDKRDLEVLRNIVILLCIYIVGGVPTLLFLFTNINILYLSGIVTFTFTVVVEKICTISLDRELRQALKSIIHSSNRVMPFENSLSLTREQNKTVRLQ
ncbi:unnamed protein product [Adineta steineri]|uniref:G-protein coupled receptors family 1 profile domain-containing protein n=1 Tax=Adineta steineri TaxID=433720 RepID=A0A813X4Y3_9BILA|nr:unnamed protein product [Adineta steineri]CAF0864676.1 unnamed protein product [Adineta steineri]